MSLGGPLNAALEGIFKILKTQDVGPEGETASMVWITTTGSVEDEPRTLLKRLSLRRVFGYAGKMTLLIYPLLLDPSRPILLAVPKVHPIVGIRRDYTLPNATP
jgi:hypothetical protein